MVSFSQEIIQHTWYLVPRWVRDSCYKHGSRKGSLRRPYILILFGGLNIRNAHSHAINTSYEVLNSTAVWHLLVPRLFLRTAAANASRQTTNERRCVVRTTSLRRLPIESLVWRLEFRCTHSSTAAQQHSSTAVSERLALKLLKLLSLSAIGEPLRCSAANEMVHQTPEGCMNY